MECDKIDLALLEQYAGGDSEAMAGFLAAFHETFDEEIKQLQSQLTDGENATWSASAHKLKGCAAFVGAQVLSNVCAKAQEQRNSTKEHRQELLQRIIHLYSSVCNEIQST